MFIMHTSAKLQKRTVGPLDRRRRVTRCLGCAKRRIKCEGGFPCAQCTRQNTMCVPQQQSGRGMTLFVNQTQQSETGGCLQSSHQPNMAIVNGCVLGDDQLAFIGRDKGSRFLDHFVSFIQQNLFTTSFSSIVPDLLPLILTSPILYHAVLAVGGLDASRHSGGRALKGEKSPGVDAMTSYHTSMSILRSRLGDRNVVQREDVLWATFFLGLYETIPVKAGSSTCFMGHQ
ncbi:hypothetical protein N7523_007595 [Penicillium sp. IBT 18751x]|nr:hypothetical protein N7523_007595 [Penicillium sp. IBT 18751x]